MTVPDTRRDDLRHEQIRPGQVYRLRGRFTGLWQVHRVQPTTIDLISEHGARLRADTSALLPATAEEAASYRAPTSGRP